MCYADRIVLILGVIWGFFLLLIIGPFALRDGLEGITWFGGLCAAPLLPIWLVLRLCMGRKGGIA